MADDIKPIKFKNDSDRLKSEFDDLNNNNPKLRQLLEDLSAFVNKEYDKELVITMILRTQDEQDHLYKNDPNYQSKKFKSPHQFWHGCDIRSLTFNPEEIKGIENYLNNKYNKENYYSWTARNHAITGGAEHFHLQFAMK